MVTCTDSQSVGFMADGAGRCFSGNSTIGACLIDAVDAFALPTLSGVGEAWQDGVPLLLIVLSPLLSEDQSVGPLAEFSKKILVAETDWEEKIVAASRLAAAPPAAPVTLLLPRSQFLKASQTLDCPRGPSLLECPSSAPFQPSLPAKLKAPRVQLTDPAPLSLEAGASKAVSLLLSSRRPWIHVGMGCASRLVAEDRLVEKLAESLEAPVSSTFSGKGVLREDHPLWLWSIAGPAMPSHLREVVDSCDTILILGAQMGEIASCRRQWPAKRTKVIHVDADPCVLGANFLPDLPVLGDVVEFLRFVLAEFEAKGIKANERPSQDDPQGLHDPNLRAELKAAHEALRAQMRAEATELPNKQCFFDSFRHLFLENNSM